MKRLTVLTAVFLLLSGCGSSSASEAKTTPEAQAEQIQASKTPEAEEAASEQTAASAADLRAEMEPYEDLRVAYLGTISADRSMEEVLARAEMIPGCAGVSVLAESRTVYGKKGTNENYVYLFIPAENTDVTAGTYNYYAGEIVDVFLQEENAEPFVYVETGEMCSPAGMISYVRHLETGDIEGFMYTGLTAVPPRLRTDYHMGIVDITPYEEYDSADLPFFAQAYFDKLCSYETIQDALNQGGTLNVMEEMIWDGKAYTVYTLDLEGAHTLYAITRDSLQGTEPVLVMEDVDSGWQPLGKG